MRFRHLVLLASFLFAELLCAQQAGTLQMRLIIRGQLRKRIVKEKNVKVTVNDTLTKYMLTNHRGFTGYLPLQAGKHTLCIEVKGFKQCIRKNVRIEQATGRRITVKLKKTEDHTDQPAGKTK